MIHGPAQFRPVATRSTTHKPEATSHGNPAPFPSYLQRAAALGGRSCKLTKHSLSLAQKVPAYFLGGNAMAAGFFSAAADGVAACPAYPWPNDGAQGGRKVFMRSDCAACHSMLPYAGLREAAPAEAEARVAEIIVVNEQKPQTASPLQNATYTTPVTATKMLQGLRRSNLYTAQELKKMALPTPVWLQFLQPFSHT